MSFISIETEDWITLAEVARIRKISRQAVTGLVKRGRLETINIAGYTFVKKSSVLSFTEDQPGRKPKKKVSNG